MLVDVLEILEVEALQGFGVLQLQTLERAERVRSLFG